MKEVRKPEYLEKTPDDGFQPYQPEAKLQRAQSGYGGKMCEVQVHQHVAMPWCL